MEPVGEAPRCANQVYVRVEGTTPEPTRLCSCAAGFIHMDDCPVAMGLECLHFRRLEGEPPAVSPVEEEELGARLSRDFLSRPYFHRVRSLAPAGAPWQRRREELYAFYATVELEADESAPPDEEDDRYERERHRLIALRKKREEARKEREERTREERARERARLGIKTVVEKAQEAVASQGNIASSVVDDLELPAQGRRKRRRRRRGKRGPSAAAGPAPPPSREDAAAP
ncbi:MAG: hypothetical protein ACYTED_13480, partial [Planctomycetota bacterium]